MYSVYGLWSSSRRKKFYDKRTYRKVYLIGHFVRSTCQVGYSVLGSWYRVCNGTYFTGSCFVENDVPLGAVRALKQPLAPVSASAPPTRPLVHFASEYSAINRTTHCKSQDRHFEFVDSGRYLPRVGIFTPLLNARVQAGHRQGPSSASQCPVFTVPQRGPCLVQPTTGDQSMEKMRLVFQWPNAIAFHAFSLLGSSPLYPGEIHQ